MTRLLAVLLLLCAAPATGQVVDIRSGDHGSFTRLVLTIPEGSAWTVGRDGQAYVLRVGDSSSFRTEGVFGRISRDRIANLVPRGDGSGLTVELACDCHADAFLWQPDRLVLDIVDGPAPPGSEFELAMSQDETVSSDIPTLPVSGLLPVVLPGNLPPPMRSAAAPQLPPATEPVIPPHDLRAAMAPEEGPSDGGPPSLDATAARLFESLSQAAAAGALTLDPDARRVTQTGGPSTGSEAGFAAHLSFDTSLAGVAAGSEAFCPPPTPFDTAAWSWPEEDFATGLAQVRDGLTDAAGYPTPSGSVALAQFYLSWGLGREASEALDLAVPPPGERDIYLAMGRLLDDAPDGASFPTVALGCGGPSQLWTLLIRGSSAGMSAADLEAARLAFVRLPVPLAGILGSRLATILTEDGHAHLAEAVLSAVSRNGSSDPSNTALATADVELALSGPVRAVETLTLATSDPHSLSPEAVVQLVDLSLRGGVPIARETIDLAAAMAQEHRGSADGAALALAEIRALSSLDAFAEAFGRLDSHRVDLETMLPGAAQDLMHELMRAFEERSGDDAFLDRAFRPLPAGLDSDTRHLLADRLDRMGFAERGDEIRAATEDISNDVPHDASGGTSLAAAPVPPVTQEAILHDSQATVATALAAETGPTSPIPAPEPMSADILREGGAAQEAAQADALTAWRLGDWTGLTGTDDPVLAEAARAVLAPTQRDPSQPDLAARRQLLTEADDTRSMVGALLERFPAPQEATAPQP